MALWVGKPRKAYKLLLNRSPSTVAKHIKKLLLHTAQKFFRTITFRFEALEASSFLCKSRLSKIVFTRVENCYRNRTGKWKYWGYFAVSKNVFGRTARFEGSTETGYDGIFVSVLLAVPAATTVFVQHTGEASVRDASSVSELTFLIVCSMMMTVGMGFITMIVAQTPAHQLMHQIGSTSDRGRERREAEQGGGVTRAGGWRKRYDHRTICGLWLVMSGFGSLGLSSWRMLTQNYLNI